MTAQVNYKTSEMPLRGPVLSDTYYPKMNQDVHSSFQVLVNVLNSVNFMAIKVKFQEFYF